MASEINKVTIAVTNKLDVMSKYKELLKESMGKDSPYIRAKETLEKMYTDNDVPQESKGEVLASLISSLNTSVMTTSMNTALEWAAKEKDLELKKIELEKQLQLLNYNIEQAKAEVDRTTNADLIQQAESLRQHGRMTVVNGRVVGLSDEGLMFYGINLAKEKVESEQKAQNLSEAKVKETYAGINKLVADTFVNYGSFTGYEINESGITGITDTTPIGYTTLSKTQIAIGKEQAKGYAWNAWSNVASGLGSTIGVALTSETDIFTGTNGDILSEWKDTISKMNRIQPPTF